MPGDDEARVTRVLDAMRDNIERGTWPPGSRIPSIPHLTRDFRARGFKVGQSTVGRASTRLRFFGFLYGPQGGATRVASPEVLNLARAAWATAEMARDLNRQT